MSVAISPPCVGRQFRHAKRPFLTKRPSFPSRERVKPLSPPPLSRHDHGLNRICPLAMVCSLLFGSTCASRSFLSPCRTRRCQPFFSRDESFSPPFPPRRSYPGHKKDVWIDRCTPPFYRERGPGGSRLSLLFLRSSSSKAISAPEAHELPHHVEWLLFLSFPPSDAVDEEEVIHLFKRALPLFQFARFFLFRRREEIDLFFLLPPFPFFSMKEEQY